MNKTFLFSSIVIAVAVNMSIIGCNRQGSSEQPSHDSVAVTTGAGNETPPTSATTTLSTSPPATTPVIDVDAPKATTAKPQKSPYEKAEIEIKTFRVDVPNTGWGYDIFIDKRQYLHQPNIPAVSGNNGFSSEANARKAAEFVASKIRRNIMPPSVDPKELDSIGVLK